MFTGLFLPNLSSPNLEQLVVVRVQFKITKRTEHIRQYTILVGLQGCATCYETVHRTVLSHAWQQKTPFTSVKGEFSAVPPYFIYAVTHISLTFYNGNYSGITYFNRSIIRFRSYLPSSFFRNCLSAGSSSSFAQSPSKLP